MNKEFETIGKLGFGFMRLPMDGKEIDMAETCNMVDSFMEKGFNYFDTAYVYIGGKSEVALRESLVKRYPRESFKIASKLPLWDIKTKDEIDKIFNETMERLGLEYIDFYLLHSMNLDRFKQAEEMGAWDYIKEKKAEGKIKHIGFSFHDSAEHLEEALKMRADDTEFIQLQINYIDWESDSIQSRKCYEVARKYNKPVIIMEPVKGGSLVALPTKAQDIFKSVNPDLSIPSWAIRYCASLEGVLTVLSGMSNMEQMNDNLSYMADFKPLNDAEYKAVDEAVEIINKVPTIPCTNCKYCVDGCPMNINIPRLFSVANQNKKFGDESKKPYNIRAYKDATKENGLASACLQCGACESHCPQHIEIIEELKKIAAAYEE
ncbi:MAG: 4Fe-4S dicluster domain-containing protein [Ruminococcaceae bacterium]|nr:4Fe-4S dicluster domain-containing protein [Oscillospiraceae bacterium]